MLDLTCMIFVCRDAKIAALEKTSQETEKLIAEARSEKIRHMDEVHAAQKKVADLESRHVYCHLVFYAIAPGVRIISRIL